MGGFPIQFRASVPRNHEFLLPPCIDEWLPRGDIARGFDGSVGHRSDVSFGGGGRPCVSSENSSQIIELWLHDPTVQLAAD